jgi:hypothetical protein
VSRKEWPWYWGAILWAISSIVIIGGALFARWLLATNSDSPFSPPAPKVFSDQTVTVTIPGNVLNQGQVQTPDNADKVPPASSAVVPVVIPGPAFEKIAPARELWVHQPPSSKVSMWGPTIATLIVGTLAVFGVIITWWQRNEADKRSEWWRRTAWAFERTFRAAPVALAQTDPPLGAAQAPPAPGPAEEAAAAKAAAAKAEATLGWTVLGSMMGSKLATKDDSLIVQIIATQVALGQPAGTEEGNAANGAGQQQPPGTA